MSIDLMRDKPTVGVPIGQGTNGSGAQLQPVNPAYNTYVGARYVPVFAGEWDATKTYEPLTIVMWQGNSYTSKTFVPAQTEISNEDFWALTGNYNAQVEMYRQEVANLKNELSNTKKSQLIILGEEGMACNASSYIKNFFQDSVIYSLNGGTWANNSYINFFKSVSGNAPTTNCDVIICGGYNDLRQENIISANIIAFASAYKESGLTGRIYYSYDFWTRDYTTRLKIGEVILPVLMQRLSENNITLLDGLYLIAHNYDFLDANDRPLLTANSGFYYAQCLWNLYKTGFPNDWQLTTLDLNVNPALTIKGDDGTGTMVDAVPAGMMVANGSFIFKTYQTQWSFNSTSSNKIRIGDIPYTPGKINFFKPDNRFYCDCCITVNSVNIPCWISAEGTSIYINISGSVNNLSGFVMHPSSSIYQLTEF